MKAGRVLLGTDRNELPGSNRHAFVHFPIRTLANLTLQRVRRNDVTGTPAPRQVGLVPGADWGAEPAVPGRLWWRRGRRPSSCGRVLAALVLGLLGIPVATLSRKNFARRTNVVPLVGLVVVVRVVLLLSRAGGGLPSIAFASLVLLVMPRWRSP